MFFLAAAEYIFSTHFVLVLIVCLLGTFCLVSSIVNKFDEPGIFRLLLELVSHERSDVIQIFCCVLTGEMIEWEEYFGFLCVATVETSPLMFIPCSAFIVGQTPLL